MGEGSANWVAGRVVGKRCWTARLISLYVDAPVEPFQAGQFTRLALDIDGERVARPYSFVNAPHERPLEFYFITVPQGVLTDRLHGLEAGAALWVARRASGFFTLDAVPDAASLWLLATGTALGVFLSLLRTAEPWHRFRRVILVHAVRQAEELTYREEIAGFARAHPGQFTFVPFVSREATDFALAGRIPQAIADGRLAQRAAAALDPGNAQVMLCGNGAMVRDTTEILQQRGFAKNRRQEPGQITTEKYW